MRKVLYELQKKHEASAHGVDHDFHEAALLDGLTVAGRAFHSLYRDCLARSATQVPPWKRMRRAQRAYQLVRYAEASASVPGMRVECGVLRGLSALLLASTWAALDPGFDGSGFYLVDSFEGLSAMHPADAIEENRYAAKPGHFGATSREHVQRVMATFPRCEVLKGWIPAVLDSLPEAEWAFVHLDVDLYEPTRDTLQYFIPRLAKGGVVVNDDYLSARFPGAGQAWDEYMSGRDLPFLVLDSGQAVYVNRPGA
jgi:O-methyltransferase